MEETSYNHSTQLFRVSPFLSQEGRIGNRADGRPSLMGTFCGEISLVESPLKTKQGGDRHRSLQISFGISMNSTGKAPPRNDRSRAGSRSIACGTSGSFRSGTSLFFIIIWECLGFCFLLSGGGDGWYQIGERRS